MSPVTTCAPADRTGMTAKLSSVSPHHTPRRFFQLLLTASPSVFRRALRATGGARVHDREDGECTDAHHEVRGHSCFAPRSLLCRTASLKCPGRRNTSGWTLPG